MVLQPAFPLHPPPRLPLLSRVELQRRAILQGLAARETTAQAAISVKNSLPPPRKTLCKACRDQHAKNINACALVEKRAPASLLMHIFAVRFRGDYVVS